MKGHISKRRMLCGAVIALRPTLSPAAHAKAAIKRLEAQIADAKRANDTAKVERLEREHSWLVTNSL